VGPFLLDLILHLDVHLLALVHDYGVWVYAILFLIIFAETGLVVTPFLPGDSLLFVAGTLCGLGALEVSWLIPLLILAAFSGDNTNYWIGRTLGLSLFERLGGRFIKREYLEKTNIFYRKHGGKTILFARFLPIIRTFAPFVAGLGMMRYQLFVLYSGLGGVIWIGSLVLAGYFFGNIPAVRENLSLIILAFVLIPMLLIVREYLRQHKKPDADISA
jgi:membrane-associated protein